MKKPNTTDNYKIEEGPLKVELIKILKGANYFSAGPVVLTRLNLGEYDEVFSNDIEHFYEKLESILPSLYDHHCSEGKPGGFFFRVRTGTLMGHVVEHVAIELQSLAGIEASYGKTRSTLKQGVYNIIFRFIDDQAGIYAAKASVNLINSILLSKEFDVQNIIDTLIKIREERLLGPSTQAIVDEAIKRQIPVFRLDQHNLIQLGSGKYQKKVRATLTSKTHFVAVENTFDKFLSTLTLRDSGLPVPATYLAENISQVKSFFKNIHSSVVVKPMDSSKGEKVFVDIDNKDKLAKVFKLCSGKSSKVLLQEQVEGDTIRILVIDGKMVAATKLTPPIVKGDGNKNIQQLIDKLNSSEAREPGDKGKLTQVIVDENVINAISLYGYTLNSVLPEGETLKILSSCNPAYGAISENITDSVHPENRFLAERAAAISGLNVAGITVITKDISTPVTETAGVVLEVKAAPDFRMHLNPAKGESINPAVPLMDMLFPKESKVKVPLISITGSAGKSVCAYIVNFALEKEGYNTGLACSDGLFSAGRKIINGNMTFSENAAAVLGDPEIDCAILETSIEGILDNGLGYQFADIGVFLNIYENHINTGDIEYREDLAYAKSVVAEEVFENGFSVLNADCPFIMDSMKRLYSKPALFCSNPLNKAFTSHITKGGLGVCIRDEKVFLHNRSGRWVLAEVSDVPLFFNGQASLFHDSVLAACCTLAALGVEPMKIGTHIKEFKPLPHYLPGRMNFVKLENHDVLFDIPKNKKAFDEIKKLRPQRYTHIAAIVLPAINLEDDEISAFAEYLTEFADKIIIKDSISGKPDKKLLTYYADDNYISSLSNKERIYNTDYITEGSLKKLSVYLKQNNFPELEMISNLNINEIIKQIPESHFPVVIGKYEE